MDSNYSFETKIVETSKMIIWIKNVINDIQYLYSSSEDLNPDSLEKNQIFFSRILVYSWTFLTIEIMKIYDKKGHFGLRKLLNISINEYRNLKLNGRISLQELKELLLELDNNLVNEKIVRIKELRDEHYAHYDNKALMKEINIPLHEFKFLATKAEDILTLLGKHQKNWAFFPKTPTEYYFLFEELNG